jgi:nucleotide-binding universal stress UspA family protein
VHDECEIVLFHVTGIPPELLEHRGGNTPAEERELEREIGEEGDEFRAQIRPTIERDVFGPAKEMLHFRAMTRKPSVQTLLATSPSSDAASDILAEASRGGYDAVVVGRHVHSGIMHFVLGGTASKVVHHLKTTAIWLVP